MARLACIVERKIMETDDTCSLRLAFKEGGRPNAYAAGQFVNVRWEIDGEAVERSYSLSSAPGVDEFFQLTVKKVEGGRLSPFLVEQLAEGDAIEISEPLGRFFAADFADDTHFILIGAGSGVTPLFSMLKWILASRDQSRVTLIYTSRSEAGIIFREELEAWMARHQDRLKVVHVLTRPSEAWAGERGRLDTARLYELLQKLPKTDVPEVSYLCGPPPFMDCAEEALARRGLARQDIHRESFEVAAAISADSLDEASTARIAALDAGEVPAAPCQTLVVQLGGDEQQLTLAPGETVLAAVLRAGLDAPFSCQEGTCLSCMCRVEEGAVRMKAHELIGLTRDDLGADVALACLCRPDSAVVRLSFDDV